MITALKHRPLVSWLHVIYLFYNFFLSDLISSQCLGLQVGHSDKLLRLGSSLLCITYAILCGTLGKLKGLWPTTNLPIILPT